MGERWSINQYGGITRDGCFLAHNEIPVTANADCDAYEARIAELEAELVIERTNAHDTAKLSAGWADACAELTAELARVKAESLRVVEDGEACELQDCVTEYCFIDGKDRLNVASEFAKRNYPTMRVQPITLERWEMEE